MRRSAVRLLPRRALQCRSLVRNAEGIPHSTPPCTSIRTIPPVIPPTRVPVRSLFGFGKPKQKQSDVPPHLPPGLLEVASMTTALDQKLGHPPPPDTIIAAYRKFLAYYKHNGKTPVDHNTYALVRALDHLLKTADNLVTETDLRETLARIRRGTKVEHSYLAEVAYSALFKQGLAKFDDLEMAMEVFSGFGDVKRCSTHMAKWKGDITPRMWELGLKACLVQGDEKGALKMWETMEASGVTPTQLSYEYFMKFYGSKKDIEQVQAWFEKLVKMLPGTPSVEAYSYLFDATTSSAASNEEAKVYSKTNLDHLEEFTLQAAVDGKKELAESYMLLVLKWKAIIYGEASLDNSSFVESYWERAKQLREGAENLLRPTEQTVIDLMEFYIDRGLLSLAGKVGTHWAGSWSIPKSDYIRRAEMLLMLKKGDLVSALRIRDQLSVTPVVQTKEYVRDSMLLLQAICSEHWVPAETVDRLYEDLESDKVELDTPTVTALSLFLARTRKSVPLIDLLQKFVHVMSREDRQSILLALGNMAAHEDTSIQDALMIYQICFQLFPEMGVGLYTDFMRLFFAHGNRELGVKVFQTMTQNPGAKPDEEAYITVLYGIAQGEAELEKVRLVNRVMKLDTDVVKTVELQNALMAAYVAAFAPQYAVDVFWEQWRSEEGPNHTTINLALEACRRYRSVGWRASTANEIWTKLKAHKAYLDEKNYYYLFITFLQGEDVPQAFNVVMELRSKGFSVTPQMLALLQQTAEEAEWDRIRKWAAHNEWDAYREWEDNKAELVQAVEGVLKMLWIEPLKQPPYKRVLPAAPAPGIKVEPPPRLDLRKVNHVSNT